MKARYTQYVMLQNLCSGSEYGTIKSTRQIIIDHLRVPDTNLNTSFHASIIKFFEGNLTSKKTSILLLSLGDRSKM
jgi:hypothetical protein